MSRKENEPENKTLESENIKKQTEEYLNNGGNIEHIEKGESGLQKSNNVFKGGIMKKEQRQRRFCGDYI